MSDRVLWQKSYEGGCDRLALSPDGKTIYVPSLEKGHWHVVDAIDGRVMARITTNSGAHNTIYGPDGGRVYLAGLKSPVLQYRRDEASCDRKDRRPFQQRHPSLHDQRQPDPMLRQRQRSARL